MADYHNTNGESGDELDDSRRQARRQQAIVLAYFRENPHRLIAPHQIPMPQNTPITSTRRAVTNLTKLGELEKTRYRVPGLYPGKLVYTWRLRPEERHASA